MTWKKLLAHSFVFCPFSGLDRVPHTLTKLDLIFVEASPDPILMEPQKFPEKQLVGDKDFCAGIFDLCDFPRLCGPQFPQCAFSPGRE